ncbi:thioredoxin [Mariniphaga anaerophila]|uniref:Thioredoxin n=1 Tax=Mariniphaga anaerophila TaxID=1484053 RepID=A0A1M5DG94_9BACT|nr:thioredoxin domain-containing protein [Mariniphaga anaerophila]SHF65945.1 thioredoxin [Mariniphaga anaerophila]
MKKLVFVMAVAAFSFYSCNSGQAKSNENETAESSAAQVQTVADNSPASTASADGGSILLTKSVFLDKVWDYNTSPQEWKYKGDKPALIDFYADWCGPCKIASPILEEISKEYAGKIYVYKIDTQKERELASVFGISGIPAFLYIPVEGQPVMLSGIARSKEDTKKMFQDNIDKYLLTSN